MKTSQITDEKEIEQIIRACRTCFLGVVDDEGTPSVFPMTFAYDDGVIYLHSAPESTPASLAAKRPCVCIAFSTDEKLVFQHPQVACSYSLQAQSVMAWGNVEFTDDLAEKECILNLVMAQYTNGSFTYSLPALQNVKIWKVKIDKITAKSFGESRKQSVWEK